MSLKTINSIPNEVKEEIKRLYKQGASESTVCKEIFTSLLEDDNCEALCSCLKTFEAIPEDILVKILTHLLHKTLEEESPKRNSTLYSYVNVILDMPFTDIFLQEHLKQMSVTNTKILFKYLVVCLDSNPLISTQKYLSINKIIDWICILLDAQYHTMTLSSDKEFLLILETLNELLKCKFSYFDELDKLEAILGNLKSQTTNSNDKNLIYSIEKLVIK